MNLANAFLTSRVSCASVYKAASVAALCCPACGMPQEDELQVLKPCKHLACVYDQEALEFTYTSDDFKQRVSSSKRVITGQLGANILSRLGYGDELLALDLTRAGCWRHELFAFDFNAG